MQEVRVCPVQVCLVLVASAVERSSQLSSRLVPCE